jgi:hypothetical protein
LKLIFVDERSHTRVDVACGQFEFSLLNYELPALKRHTVAASAEAIREESDANEPIMPFILFMVHLPLPARG